MPADSLIVGRALAPFGVRGWIRVKSYTQPATNLPGYGKKPWLVASGARAPAIDCWERRGGALLLHLEGVDDRDAARSWCPGHICLRPGDLPDAPPGEYYWHQLVGLRVQLADGRCLGFVESMLETGANDVMVVQGDDGSMDGRRRLVPWLADVVRRVDLDGRRIEVQWDADF